MTYPPHDKNKIIALGTTRQVNTERVFGIRNEDRSRHMYVIGKSGTGKSTLLENMAIQDIRNGEGVMFIDPHGQSVATIMNHIPHDRVDDVINFSPFDVEKPLGFNVLEQQDEATGARHLVADGLISAFKKIWEAEKWSDRMAHILNNTLLSLIEYSDATLLDVTRVFADDEYRKKIIDNVTDPQVKAFWLQEYARYSERMLADATPAIQNKLGQFTSSPVIRNIIGQKKSSFDLRKIIDGRKILLFNLSKGRVGEQNALLLGGLISTKLYLAALSRANVSPKELQDLPPFFCYVDEFQSLANDAFGHILEEARKYKLGLTLAHQYVDQLDEEIANSVWGNVGTLISFRIGPKDATILEELFGHTLKAEDIVGLGFAKMYVSLLHKGSALKPFSAESLPPIPLPMKTYVDEVVEQSRNVYGRDYKVIETDIREKIESFNKRIQEKNKARSQHKKGNTYEKRHHSQDKRYDAPHKKSGDYTKNKKVSGDTQTLKDVLKSATKEKKSTAPPLDNSDSEGYTSIESLKL